MKEADANKTSGVDTDENKISFADAMQMSLLDAQKKNIEADTPTI